MSDFSLQQRSAGILFHPTSLPGPHGSGDLGPEAYAFIDFLVSAGQRWWQMLPIGPPGGGDSPYSALSAFAGSPLLISLDGLHAEGLLLTEDLEPIRGLRVDRVQFPAVTRYRVARLRRAFERFVERGGLRERHFRKFRENEAHWLEDHALFHAIRTQQGEHSWTEWPAPLRLRRESALRAVREELRTEIEYELFVQYVFDRQWSALRDYANRRGVGLIGDIPIFVALDSSDVWANRKLFDLDKDGRPRHVSGVPPDAFNRSGQRWGHPQYRWGVHQRTGFAWWISRFERILAQFDAVRIDHFLGFYRVWNVPGRHRTARHGRWMKTPGRELYEAVRDALGRPRIIAEDLGATTPQAFQLRDDFGWPGMRLLHWAFGGETAPYHAPHAFPHNCVVYPGTHDNDTIVGWFQDLRRAARRKRKRANRLTTYERVLRYVNTSGREIHWDIIRLAYSSVANTAIIPAQDLLGLGSSARMNTPGTVNGNWHWRLPPGRLNPTIAKRLHELAQLYCRLPQD